MKVRATWKAKSRKLTKTGESDKAEWITWRLVSLVANTVLVAASSCPTGTSPITYMQGRLSRWPVPYPSRRPGGVTRRS